MEDYPEELRTPPVSLIALVGCPDHHSLISTHLLSEQPPINILALPDLSKISLLFSSNNSPSPPSDPSTAGILKRDWLLKHRTKVPSVLAALFSSQNVSGDPAQWLQLCTDLEDLKTLIRPKNIKLALIIVQSSSNDEISEDIMIALRKRAELDAKYLVIFNPTDSLQLKQSLHKLANTFAELANAYYRDEGRRIKTRVEKKSFNSNELNVRYCFKVAVYAEFRRDWVEALKFYEDAYHILQEPAYYYQLAGQYLKEKKTSFELAMSMLQTADEIDGSAESVAPSIYVGQFARLLEQGGAFVMQPLTDEEYIHYAIAEGKRFPDSFEIIALLRKSHESYANLKAQRMASLCGFQMAREYFAVDDFSNAKQFMDGVAALYRQEGWVTLLWDVLGFLRKCSRKCRTVREFIEYSLEMAALPVSSGTGIQSFRSKECDPAGPPGLAQKEAICKEVFHLVNGETEVVLDDDNSVSK